LRPYRLVEKIYEIGFYIKSSFLGKGYASEAIKAVVEYAYTSLDANGVFAEDHPKMLFQKICSRNWGFNVNAMGIMRRLNSTMNLACYLLSSASSITMYYAKIILPRRAFITCM
jgi:hypothetical protein